VIEQQDRSLSDEFADLVNSVAELKAAVLYAEDALVSRGEAAVEIENVSQITPRLP
jgi:hypothetical protein